MKELLYDIVLSAGKVLLQYFRKNFSVEYKTRSNPVTKVDRESEIIIKNFIKEKFSQDEIISEETCSEIDKVYENKRYWIIDPLDGTVNYTHGLPIFSVSIAIMEKKEIVEGIVYNPVMKEIFYAKKGNGAYKNGKRISVSSVKDITKSLLVTGFPYYTYKNPKRVFNLFNKFSVAAQAVRRLGSAAIDLCYVAEGIFEGFWEENLNVWDVAAGSLIVQEAGGRVTDFSGRYDYLFGKEIVASNGRVHRKMLEIIDKYEKYTSKN